MESFADSMTRNLWLWLCCCCFYCMLCGLFVMRTFCCCYCCHSARFIAFFRSTSFFFVCFVPMWFFYAPLLLLLLPMFVLIHCTNIQQHSHIGAHMCYGPVTQFYFSQLAVMCRNYMALDAWQFVFSVVIERCNVEVCTTNKNETKSVATHTSKYLLVVFVYNSSTYKWQPQKLSCELNVLNDCVDRVGMS